MASIVTVVSFMPPSVVAVIIASIVLVRVTPIVSITSETPTVIDSYGTHEHDAIMSSLLVLQSQNA